MYCAETTHRSKPHADGLDNQTYITDMHQGHCKGGKEAFR
jgi:hypothetical protein